MRVHDAFRPLLRDFDLDALDADPSTIYGVWSDLRLGFTNRAWERFAEENGAPDLLERWPLGASIADVIPARLARWFREIVEGARGLHPEGFVYPCSSAEVERSFRLTAYPVAGQGLLLVNSLIHEMSLAGGETTDRLGADYQHAEGVVVQCSHCKRFRAATLPARWDWIPQWLNGSLRNISHGLCGSCAGAYYSGYI